MVQPQTAVLGSNGLDGFPPHVVGLVRLVDAAAEAAASALVAACARSAGAALPALALLAGLFVSWIG